VVSSLLLWTARRRSTKGKFFQDQRKTNGWGIPPFPLPARHEDIYTQGEARCPPPPPPFGTAEQSRTGRKARAAVRTKGGAFFLFSPSQAERGTDRKGERRGSSPPPSFLQWCDFSWKYPKLHELFFPFFSPPGTVPISVVRLLNQDRIAATFSEAIYALFSFFPSGKNLNGG